MVEPITGLDGLAPASRPQSPSRASRSGRAFADVLARTPASKTPLRFSAHALERIARRGIGVDETVLARLQEGVSRVAAKGGRDSLVLLDGTAFVVSVAHRTVITAVDREHMREHVFTNIDSAVLA